MIENKYNITSNPIKVDSLKVLNNGEYMDQFHDEHEEKQ